MAQCVYGTDQAGGLKFSLVMALMYTGLDLRFIYSLWISLEDTVSLYLETASLRRNCTCWFFPPCMCRCFLLLLKHVDRCNDSPAAFVETAGSNRETINETRKKTGARMMRLKGSYCI